MKVKVYPTSGCTRELRVEVEAETVQTEIDGLYANLSREAVLPGFRKGKAPLEMVKRRFKANVKEEIIRDTLPKYFREAVLVEKLEPIAQPRITEYSFEEGSPMRFVAVVEIRPEIKLGEYMGLKVKRSKAEVTSDDVDKVMNDLREQSATFVAVQGRVAQSGDLCLTDFEGKIDGKVFEGGHAKAYPVAIGQGGVLKDFEDALVGMTPGQTKEFPVVFPADYPKTELAGKTAVFTVTVHEVKEKILPRIDDAFAQEAYRCKDVADLRDKITEDMKSRRSVERRNKMVDQVADQLIEIHTFDVPPSLVELEHQRLARQAVERMRSQGVDVSRWGEDRQKEFVEQFAKSAERNVRVSMLMDRIADKEGIVCGEVDFNSHLDKLAQALKQSKDAVKRFVEQKDQKAEIEERIRYEKALDFLIEKADIVEG